MAAANVFEQARTAIRAIDINGNGVPDIEEPIILDLAWRGLLMVSRKHFAGTLFHQGLELAEDFRQLRTGHGSSPLEVMP